MPFATFDRQTAALLYNAYDDGVKHLMRYDPALSVDAHLARARFNICLRLISAVNQGERDPQKLGCIARGEQTLVRGAQEFS